MQKKIYNYIYPVLLFCLDNMYSRVYRNLVKLES